MGNRQANIKNLETSKSYSSNSDAREYIPLATHRFSPITVNENTPVKGPALGNTDMYLETAKSDADKPISSATQISTPRTVIEKTPIQRSELANTEMQTAKPDAKRSILSATQISTSRTVIEKTPIQRSDLANTERQMQTAKPDAKRSILSATQTSTSRTVIEKTPIQRSELANTERQMQTAKPDAKRSILSATQTSTSRTVIEKTPIQRSELANTERQMQTAKPDAKRSILSATQTSTSRTVIEKTPIQRSELANTERQMQTAKPDAKRSILSATQTSTSRTVIEKTVTEGRDSLNSVSSATSRTFKTNVDPQSVVNGNTSVERQTLREKDTVVKYVNSDSVKLSEMAIHPQIIVMDGTSAERSHLGENVTVVKSSNTAAVKPSETNVYSPRVINDIIVERPTSLDRGICLETNKPDAEKSKSSKTNKKSDGSFEEKEVTCIQPTSKENKNPYSKGKIKEQIFTNSAFKDKDFERTKTCITSTASASTSETNLQQMSNFHKNSGIALTQENKSLASSHAIHLQKEFNSYKNKDNVLKNNTASRASSRVRKLHKKINPENKTDSLVKQETMKKTTFLYLRLDQIVKDSFDFHSFLIERMQKQDGVKFEIVDKISRVDENCTVFTLKFASRRLGQRAHNLLNLTNRSSQFKICSTFDQAQVDDSKKVEKNEAIFKEHLNTIMNGAKQTLKKHEEKMKKTSDDILNLKTNKGMSVDQFEKVTSECSALEDKLKQLELQISEFKLFRESQKKKLKTCWDENTFDKNVNEIRKLFGVECCRLEAALPMYARRSEIVSLVKRNQVCVILGETGSGKSTQMTQYLHQVGLSNNGIIACTQPRKVAAISLATRVAQEMATNVGQLVGYRVGMQSKLGGNTKILYTTDHALLNECLKDKTLSKYSCVIIDEAHERSIYTDLLLGIIKRCLHSRPDLKIIITSATIDPDVFVRYFDGCPVLKVSGRMFPVEVIWQPLGGEEDVFENYQNAAVEKAIKIHTATSDGDILVFMTTPQETEKCADAFKHRMKNDNNYQCFVLHGQVQAAEQKLVFQPTPSRQRKIVFATNSAETSITIPGIKYVVDTGLVKENRYDPRRNMNSLRVVMISQSSAEQRKGRAGRTGPGVCYRLYSKEQYKDMETSSLPELLKVHLGQAILKLAELGINPLEYEFVQSPDKTAISDSIKMLEDIGAMKEQRITKTGKWLSKLPVEPRHGLIIAKGKERDVLYDSVVLSSVSCVGNLIFYRGGSEADKKKSDLLKLKFCHCGGDSLTLLNVFREWDKEPERKKNYWCIKHSINSKAIRRSRDMVNEICALFKMELGLEVKHSFDGSSDTDKILQHILFECFSDNICHFMGVERAGYYSARLNQRVHIHPSSALNSLGILPQWVIFEQVQKTSRDFVAGLTPVEDSVVCEAAEKGTLHYDIEEMKDKQVYPIYTECVGSRAFWRVVGPAFSKLRFLEELADLAVDPSFAVIEADKEKGELTIFSTKDNFGKLTGLFEPDTNAVQKELEQEDTEHALSQQSGTVKVVIGAGGEVIQVFNPDDYRTVFVEKANEYTNEAIVKEKFAKFGVIKACRMFKYTKRDRWGCVTFKESSHARLAVTLTKNDDFEIAVPENGFRGQEGLTFQAKLTWCRRPSKKHAFVHLPLYELDKIMVQTTSLLINGNIVQVRLDLKTKSCLFLDKLSSNTNENDIETAILKDLGYDANSDVIEKVIVVREHVETTQTMLEIFKSRIKAAISHYAPAGEFKVEVIEPSPKAINYLAFAHFRHPDEGYNACKGLSKNFTMLSQELIMEPDISTSLFIQQNVLKVIEQDLVKSIANLSHMQGIIKLKLKELRNGQFVVDIHSSNVQQMASVCSFLRDIIQGDVLECSEYLNMKYVFTKSGKQFLAHLQSKLKCVIVVDDRTMTVSIKGNSKVRKQVRTYIDNFLKDILDEASKTILLRGPQKPGGVMKMLVTRYGIDLETLKKQMGLLYIKLDHRRHKVEVRGSAEAIQKTEDTIQTIITELTTFLSVRTRVDERPDCVVCFMPVETGQLYRLEACGHPYCMDCVKFQLQVTVKNKDFPVDCSEEQCKFHFMWRDFFYFIKNGSIALKELVASSVSAFVVKNQKNYRYCISPDCPVIYRVSSDGSMFKCSECQMTICTSCHIQYHDGLTCAMYRSEREGRSALFEKWMKTKRNAKRCPNCEIPVQKENGCNQMECYACKKIFCWLCLDVFDSVKKCYAHLQNNHGGFM